MKQNKVFLLAILTLVFNILFIEVHTETELRTSGLFKIENTQNTVKIDSVDLYTLSSNLDYLEQKYKNRIVSCINSLDVDNVLEDIQSVETDGTYIDFDRLCDAILKTQRIVDLGETTYATKTGKLTTDNTQTAVTISGATENNLSVGTRAWVNGKYVIGTGKDNDYYYNLGYSDGLKNQPSASVQYIYHTHKDGNSTEITSNPIYTNTNPGGCYVGNGHNHNVVDTCSYTDYPGSPGCDCHTCVCRDGDHSIDSYTCQNCGHGHHSSSGCGAGYVAAKRVYHCGSPINTWVIGCGKTSSTIDSAIIVFD